MTQIAKLTEKFFQNPTSLKYLQIRRILLHYGFEEVKSKHVHFVREDISLTIIIPVHHNECKPKYKRMIAKMLQNEIEL